MKTLPDFGRQVKLMRDGYWDQTSIISMPDGSMRIRKVSKGNESVGPWGEDNLRAEAQYFSSIDENLKDVFPTFLAHWDNSTIGYDMEFMNDYLDIGEFAQNLIFNQKQADDMQYYLAKRLFDDLHIPVPNSSILINSIKNIFKQAADYLNVSPILQPIAIACKINNLHIISLEEQLQNLYASNFLDVLNDLPQVRLHGDLHLENMLLPRKDYGKEWPQKLLLIDPVSVTGITAGPSLFDLAKYESYATGELPAMRKELLVVSGFNKKNISDGLSEYCWSIDWENPLMHGLKKINWYHKLRELYIDRYGEVNMPLYNLFQAYYSAAMIICSNGLEQKARALKMRTSLQQILENQ